MTKMTREWVRKADADYRLAIKLARGRDRFHDQLCFHCQQSAEKYPKALLEELSQPIPRTHILLDLLSLLQSHHGSLRPLQRGLKFLTRFAVGTRYPEETATKRQAQSATRWAGRVRQAVQALLGIRQSSRRKKTL